MTFQEFFNTLKIPLKETSTNFVAIFHAIALVFDSLEQYMREWLDSWFIQSSKGGSSYSLHAKDRGITQIKNEGTESHYQRILNAYSFNRNSSTLWGLRDILKLAIHKEFTIRELYLDNWILGEEALGFVMQDKEKFHTTFLGADYTSYYFVVAFEQPLNLG